MRFHDTQPVSVVRYWKLPVKLPLSFIRNLLSGSCFQFCIGLPDSGRTPLNCIGWLQANSQTFYLLKQTKAIFWCAFFSLPLIFLSGSFISPEQESGVRVHSHWRLPQCTGQSQTVCSSRQAIQRWAFWSPRTRQHRASCILPWVTLRMLCSAMSSIWR